MLLAAVFKDTDIYVEIQAENNELPACMSSGGYFFQNGANCVNFFSM